MKNNPRGNAISKAFAASWFIARITNAPILQKSAPIDGRMIDSQTLQPRFICQVCGNRGAQIRSDLDTKESFS